jgi:hypothetical protein
LGELIAIVVGFKAIISNIVGGLKPRQC